jgi:hypothetical protein
LGAGAAGATGSIAGFESRQTEFHLKIQSNGIVTVPISFDALILWIAEPARNGNIRAEPVHDKIPRKAQFLLWRRLPVCRLAANSPA